MSHGQMDHINHGMDRMNGMHGNPHVVDIVGREGGMWRDSYRPMAMDRFGFYGGFGPRFNPYYSRWWYPYHFYGFYWGINPYYEMDSYYWNPMVYWFYCDGWDPEFYSAWYGPDYPTFAENPTPFYRIGVFFPTVAFRDLLVGVSDWDVARQNVFRDEMRDLTVRLEADVSETVGASVVLERNAIVINNTQVLDDAAIVLDGFVTYGQTVQLPFRALLNLNDESQDSVFVSNSNTAAPSEAEIQQLQQLNNQVTTLGGVLQDPTQDPSEGQQPVSQPQPQPTEPVTSSPSSYGGEAVIVFNSQTGMFAAYNGPDARAQAEEQALATCGSDCDGVSSDLLEAGQAGAVRETWAHNGWVALATDGSGHYGTGGMHDTRNDAENSALTNCRRSGNSCYIIRSLSSFDNQPDVDGVDPANPVQ
jgi:hypothetical protein